MHTAARYRLRVLSIAFVSAIIVLSGAPSATAGGKVGAGRVRDVVAPVVAITSPASGASLSGTVTVYGTASDNTRVGKVEVWLDAGGPVLASGTATWSAALDLGAVAPGAHAITARATDSSKNSSTSTISVTVSTPEPEPTPTPTPTPSPQPGAELTVTATTITNPSLPGNLIPVGVGALAEQNGVAALLYVAPYVGQLWARFLPQAGGAGSDVRLPTDTISGFGGASMAWSGQDLWIMSGPGPVVVRRYTLAGSPFPTSAALVEARYFGDGDSRPGSIVALSGGGIVTSWHQQGMSGPQGHRVALRTAGGTLYEKIVSFMPTMASKEVLVQHPADGSVWLFSNADAWGSIGAARLTPGSNGLTVDWTDPYFIDDAQLGEFGCDPENPNLAVVSDPASGRILLAYQSALRKRYSDTVLGSQPAIAKIAADRSKTFVRFPVWVERVSNLGLAITGGDIWLAYRAVDEATLTFDTASVARFAGGTWTTVDLTRLYQPYETILFARGAPLVATRTADGTLRSFVIS